MLSKRDFALNSTERLLIEMLIVADYAGVWLFEFAFFRSAKLLRIPQIAKSFIPEMEVGGGVGCWKPDWEIVGNAIPI